jgi:hypothetical protein
MMVMVMVMMMCVPASGSACVGCESDAMKCIAHQGTNGDTIAHRSVLYTLSVIATRYVYVRVA